MRHLDFGEWVASFLDMAETEAGSAAAASRLTVGALGAALAAIQEPERLQGTSLAHTLGYSGHQLQHLLLSYLTAATPPAPLTRTDQEVLRVAFLEKRQTAQAMALSLYVSRATFFRRRHSALLALRDALLSSPRGPSEADGPDHL